MINYSDAGGRCTAVYFTDSPTLAGLIPSAGTVGDTLDDAFADVGRGRRRPNGVAVSEVFHPGHQLLQRAPGDARTAGDGEGEVADSECFVQADDAFGRLVN